MATEIDIAHILFAEADKGTGCVTAQIGDAKSGEVYDAGAVIFGSFGCLCVPPAPTPGQAGAEAIVVKTGDADIVIGGRDARSSYIAGLVTMGENCVYAPGSQACALFKNDGSINLLTTHDNTRAGKNVYFSVHPTEGAHFEWPYGFQRFEKDGYSFFHSPTGASFTIGSVSGNALLDGLGLNSYAALSAKFIRIDSSAISLGSDAGASEPVVKALSLTTLHVTPVGSCMAALNALSAALAADQILQPKTAAVAAAAVTVITAALITMGGAAIAYTSASTSTT